MRADVCRVDVGGDGLAGESVAVVKQPLSAFPGIEEPGGGYAGMTLRDYFAAQAAIALGAHDAVTARGIPWLAEHAYMLADAMLKAREAK